jgi:GT2 family glycosyltransferase
MPRYSIPFYSGNQHRLVVSSMCMSNAGVTRTEKKTVSVLICIVAFVHDQRQSKLFERAVESVLALDTTDDVQASVLIIDNASPFPVQNLIANRSSLIEVVRRTSNNIGAARSQATATALARNHEWIAFIDSDIEVPPEWLMILIREAQTNPMKDAVAIATVNRPALEGGFVRALDFLLGFNLVHLGSSQALQMPASAFSGITKIKVSHVSTCAVLLHTKALVHAGGFSAEFSRVGEDLEMCYRLKRNGSLWLLSAPVAIHRQDRNLEGWSKRMFRYGWGQIDVARDHPEHLQTRKAIPLIAALVVLLACILLALGFQAPIKLLIVGYLGFISAPIILRGISEGKFGIALSACWISLVTHVAYASGMWAGVLRLKSNPVITQPGDGK